MQQLRNEVKELCAELRSDKVPTRNKAIERLDNLLTNSKADLTNLLNQNTAEDDVGWREIFESTTLAVIKHAARVEEIWESKSVQTLRNKNHIYSGVINRLIEYNIEYGNKLLTKSCIFNAFTEGFKNRCTVIHFNELFINILERGILQSPIFVRELKVSEYSLILSHLFELNVGNNNTLRFTLLRTITHTIELAALHVQLQSDFIDYLPEVIGYANKANDERRRTEVVKLLLLFIQECGIDYHQTVCKELLQLLPIISDFYDARLKVEAKEVLFHTIYLSLRTIYPHVDYGDYNTLNINLSAEHWPKCLRKLRTIVDMEVKERKISVSCAATNLTNNRCRQHFVQMAAIVTQLFYWHLEAIKSAQPDATNGQSNENESRAKMAKPPDKMDTVLKLLQPTENSYDVTWLSILAELLNNNKQTLLNASNQRPLLESVWSILQQFNNGNNLVQIRRITSSLLQHELKLLANKSMPVNHCQDLWQKIIEFLINDEILSSNEAIDEKELMLQQLILAEKLTSQQCEQLLNIYTGKATLRRNVCMQTVRLMLLHAESCGINKSSNTYVGRIINWAYESKINVKNMLRHVAPIGATLIADTCAIAVINFLQAQPTNYAKNDNNSCENNKQLQLLLYKYHRKLLCLQEHAQQLKARQEQQQVQCKDKQQQNEKLNCLFQSHYELLMRHLQFETSAETTCRDILNDLMSLHKMSCLMHAFLGYDVFTMDNYMQCPLIKRIGFFLSHLEFQLKNNKPREIAGSQLMAILKSLDSILKIFVDHEILLAYLERQSLKEVLTFVGSALHFFVSQIEKKIDDCSDGFASSLNILATLCASKTHCQESYTYIFETCRVDMHQNIPVFLDLIKIFCSQKNTNEEIADAFVSELQIVFKLHHTNIDIIQEIINLLPAMFKYVQDFIDAKDTLMVALTSLMKLAYKKSYTSHLTAELLHAVREIAHQCADLFLDENFVNIFYSVPKFLNSPSLQVQLASINTLTALLDINWLKSTNNLLTSREYFDFCQNIIEFVNWKNLLSNTTNTEENSNAVIWQYLLAVFCFSAHHQHYALQEITYLCYKRELTIIEMPGEAEISDHFQQPLSLLSKPYMSSLIHYWTMQKFPITKFPYFVSHNSLIEFVQENLATITTCLLLYEETSDLDQIKQLQKYATKKKMIESARPLLCALVMPQASSCTESRANEHHKHMKNLLKNCEIIGVDPLEYVRQHIFDFRVIYYMLQLMNDELHFRNIYNLPVHFPVKMWYDLKYESLLNCLSFDMKSNTPTELFTTIIAKVPLELIKALGDLKRRISECFFITEKLHHFCLFWILSDLIINSLKIEENNSAFFARDIFFYLLQFYQNAENTILRQAAKIFLKKLLLKKQLNEESVIPEYEQVCSDLRISLDTENEAKINEIVSTLCENTPTNTFDDIFEYAANNRGDNDEYESISGANAMGIEGLKKLRQCISKFKTSLQSDGKLCCSLIKRLIDIVRNGNETNECSLEATACLGEIGALKINGVSFFLLAENSLYEVDSSKPPMQIFNNCLLRALEKCLLSFKARTYQAAIEVAHKILNSTYASELIQEFPYLCVFYVASATSSKNYLDIYESLPTIDWLTIFKACESHEIYDNWICTFMARIFSACTWQAFEELCTEDSNFSDAALEALVKLLLENKEQHLHNLTAMLNYFFEILQEVISGKLELKGIYRDKRVASKFLNICELIRLHNNWKVPVNLLYLAKASNHCQANFMSIMYLEMWAMQKKEDKVAKNEILGNDNFQDCAKQAYQSINCHDAIAGFLNPLHSRMDLFNLNNDWADMLLEAQSTDTLSDTKYMSVLKRNGMLALAGLSQGHSGKPQNIDYEVCWRLNQWDTPVEGHAKVNRANNMDFEFEKHHFNALKCLNNREEHNTLAAIANARQCVTLILQQISVECLQTVYTLLNWLQMLQHTEDFSQVQFSSGGNVDDIFLKWKHDESLSYGSFRCKEQLMAHKIALFKTAGVRATRKITNFYKDDPIENCLLHCIKTCKNVGEINLAKGYIASLRNMNITNEKNRLNMLLEDAEICMKTGKTQITKAILEHVFGRKEYACCLQRVRAYRMQGEFLMESNTETFATVLLNYFNNSLKLIKKFGDVKGELIQRNPNIFDVESFEDFERNNKQRAYETIAKYADREYTQLNAYINSDEYQMKCQIIEDNRKAANSLGKNNPDRDRQTGAIQLQRFANLDEYEVQNIEQKRTDNLCIAVENYIKYCCLDDTESSPAIYRIVGLWFANKLNTNLSTTIEKNIFNVPSYKFICALNQITARLSSTNVQFLELLKKLLVICMQDHPQQTLYQLLPLVFAFNDAARVSIGPHNRINIAKEIISLAKNKDNKAIIQQMEQMFPALIEFANFKVKDTKTTNLMLSEKLKRLKNLVAVQCPTIDLPVSPSKQYTITTIVKWDERVSMVGGINAPKKLMCLCSNGKSYAQLLKGMDDLRQDAVMQQVFTMINDLLQNNPETMERKLALRTYKIVALSMRSGILEWCENTVPLGIYLAGDKDGGAHKRYHPDEYTVNKCRQLSMNHLKSEADKRQKIYAIICENFTPVFQYFFFEKFLVPGVWFERRLAYINSVATTSIIGFILGLGDRHARNILIDEKTGEVVHIDFGIAFEQGKVMPTPERVPFRLTRDMVAPMGVCETNGIFKKSCEATMQVLRRHHAIITTILEVLLYDPLYIWKVVDVNSAPPASNGDEEKNLMAQRALLCVQNKLEGKQAGIIGISEVDVQVQRLINEATSHRNLCMHYPGWDPYL